MAFGRFLLVSNKAEYLHMISISTSRADLLADLLADPGRNWMPLNVSGHGVMAGSQYLRRSGNRKIVGVLEGLAFLPKKRCGVPDDNGVRPIAPRMLVNVA